MSGTVSHWAPPTSLFSSIGLQAVSGLPHTPLNGRRVPRGQLFATNLTTQRPHTSSSPIALPESMSRRPPPRTPAAHSSGRDPIMGTLSRSVQDGRDFITSAQSIGTGLEGMSKSSGSFGLGASLGNPRPFGKVTARNYALDGSVHDDEEPKGRITIDGHKPQV